MTVCEDRLRETELALESATNDIEEVRALLRQQIMEWRRAKKSWPKIKETPAWKAFEMIGGS